MISIHLSDEELTVAAAGERIPRTAHHLQICADCQGQVQAYREMLAELHQDVCYGSGRSAIDWGRQSRSIQQRILADQIERTQGRSAGFALVSSVLAVALVLTVFIGFRSTPSATVRTASTMTISDAALLDDVESRMNEDVPDALQPANLLVDEMGGIGGQVAISTPRARVRSAQ